MNRFTNLLSLLVLLISVGCTAVIAYFNGTTVEPLIEGYALVIVSVVLVLIGFFAGLIKGLLAGLPAQDDSTYLESSESMSGQHHA
jgi:hypothetical protein